MSAEPLSTHDRVVALEATVKKLEASIGILANLIGETVELITPGAKARFAVGEARARALPPSPDRG